jgi:hypothetical protein
VARLIEPCFHLDEHGLTGRICNIVNAQSAPLSELSLSKRRYSNERTISECTEILTDLQDEAINLMGNSICGPIPWAYEHLKQHLEKNETRWSLEALRYAISFLQISDLRRETELGCSSAPEWMLKFYSESIVPLTFETIPEASSLMPRYSLSETVSAQESAAAQNALRRNLTPVYTVYGELSRFQEQLLSDLPKVGPPTEAQFDWARAAEWFATSFILTANPLVGVPLTVMRWSQKCRLQQNNDEFLRVFDERFCRYLEQWQHLYDVYIPAGRTQLAFIEEKCGHIFVETSVRMLRDLDRRDFDLSGIPIRYRALLWSLKSQLKD